MKRRTPKQSEFSNRWNMSTWRKIRYLKNICVSDYHNVRHLFEAWWQIFLIPAYLTTTKNIFLRNKLEAQLAQNRLFGITQGETFGEISKLEQLFYFVSGAQWAPVYVRWSVWTNCGDFANFTFANVFGRFANAMSRFANVLLVTSPTPNI